MWAATPPRHILSTTSARRGVADTTITGRPTPIRISCLRTSSKNEQDTYDGDSSKPRALAEVIITVLVAGHNGGDESLVMSHA